MLVQNAARLLIGIRRVARLVAGAGARLYKELRLRALRIRGVFTFGRRTRMRLPKLLAALAVASVALAACGTSGGSSQTIKGTIKIGIDLPVSGSDASDGQPTQNGAKLAVKLAGKVCGTSSHTDACFTRASFPLDDAVHGAHDPGRG